MSCRPSVQAPSLGPAKGYLVCNNRVNGGQERSTFGSHIDLDLLRSRGSVEVKVASCVPTLDQPATIHTHITVVVGPAAQVPTVLREEHCDGDVTFTVGAFAPDVDHMVGRPMHIARERAPLYLHNLADRLDAARLDALAWGPNCAGRPYRGEACKVALVCPMAILQGKSAHCRFAFDNVQSGFEVHPESLEMAEKATQRPRASHGAHLTSRTTTGDDPTATARSPSKITSSP